MGEDGSEQFATGSDEGLTGLLFVDTRGLSNYSEPAALSVRYRGEVVSDQGHISQVFGSRRCVVR